MKQPLSEEEIQSYRKYGMMVDIEEVFGKGEYGIKKTFIPPEEVGIIGYFPFWVV